jgi:predicted kinase
MSAKYTIKNPNADSVIGMYADEQIGMDHPLFMVRFQSRIDAGLLYQNGTPIQDAIHATVKRMRGLFGDDIPEELVRTTVSLVYAENDALRPLQQQLKVLVDLYQSEGVNATVNKFSSMICGMKDDESYLLYDEFFKTAKPGGLGAYKLRYEFLNALKIAGFEERPQVINNNEVSSPIGLATPRQLSAEELEAEIDARLPNDARAEGQPILVLIMGPVCAGKTTLRRERFRHGYVLVDAAQLFIDLGGVNLNFPSMLEELMETIGVEVARRALAKRMNIVTEIVGAQFEPVRELIDAITSVGYRVEICAVNLDLPSCIERERSRQKDNVSAYFAEKYQMKWLLTGT